MRFGRSFYLSLPRNRKALIVFCELEEDMGNCQPVRGKSYNYLIRINSRLTRDEKMETLQHEIDHALHWNRDEYTVNKENEIRGIALSRFRRMRA